METEIKSLTTKLRATEQRLERARLAGEDQRHLACQLAKELAEVNREGEEDQRRSREEVDTLRQR
jgi:hypothetical protein